MPFEKRIAAEEVKAGAFDDSDRIGPLQYFDVQQIEQWDEMFQLPNEIAALSIAIQERANSKRFRYESISAATGAKTDRGTRSGVVRQKFAGSESILRERLGTLIHQMP